MIKNNFTRLNLIVSSWIAGLCCMLCFGGCLEQTSSEPDMVLSPNHSEHEFQKQDNRPPTSKTLYSMADILAAQGRDTECEFVLKRIIREYPGYLPAYNSLAELQMRQGRVNNAIDTIHDAFRINPEDPLLVNNLGVCWIVRGEYDKALEIFTKAAGIKPEDTRYRMNMAVALGLMARYEESLCLFKQVLPEDQANHNRKVLREKRGKVVPVTALQESL